MGFIMDGLDAETYDRKYDDRQLISRIIGYFRPQLSLMLFVAVLVVLTSLMDTAFPLLIARSLDIITSAQSAQIIGLLVATILITGVLSWTFNFLRQRYTALWEIFIRENTSGIVGLLLAKEIVLSAMMLELSTAKLVRFFPYASGKEGRLMESLQSRYFKSLKTFQKLCQRLKLRLRSPGRPRKKW